MACGDGHQRSDRRPRHCEQRLLAGAYDRAFGEDTQILVVPGIRLDMRNNRRT
jgi:hypothetical protein